LTAQDNNLNIIYSQDFEHRNAPIEYITELWSSDFNNATWRDSDHRWPAWWEGKYQDSILIDPETGSKVIKFSHDDIIVDGYAGTGPRCGDYWQFSIGNGINEVYYSYNIKFRPGWIWNEGGKLSGLYGGSEPPRDLTPPGYGEGFSAGLMFKDYGGLAFYLFYQNQATSVFGETQVWNDFQPPGLDYDNEGRFIFDVSKDRWYNITIRCVTNTFTGTTPNSDGILEGYINGKLVEQLSGLFLITYPDINNLIRGAVANFFGGSEIYQAPQRDEWAYMDDLVFFTYADGVNVPRGNTLSPSGRVLELPNLKKVYSDIEVPAVPGDLNVSIIDVRNTTIPNIAITESKVSSFGHYELNEYGLSITKSEEPINNELIIFASQDFTKILNTERVSSGLKALYVFDEGEGNQILDNSGADPPLNLEIQNPSTTKWLPGGLKVDGNTLISSKDLPTELINSIVTSNEITLEAWIKPTDVNQSGPARIISLSKDQYSRAFTLGHEGNLDHYNYIARLNTTSTDANGLPTVSTTNNFIRLNLHHVVYTRKSNGEEKIYVNGQECYTGTRGGDFSSMDNGYYLSLANEITGDRPWIGTYYLLAIYNKALNKDEIDMNFTAGLGEIRFTTNLLVEPNVTYLVTPFVRTDQGVIYGSTEVLRPWSNASVSPLEDLMEPYHGVDR
jgi:hypothetical protein